MTARLLATLALVVASMAASAQSWDLLRHPGAIALVRHAHAPGTGDPAHFRLGDCATQRNLDGRGRDQARQMGAAIRATGVPIAGVYASQWCRATETANLLDLGPVTALPALNSFFEDRAQGPAQTRALRDWAAAQPDDGARILVTHQVNITALTGESTRSGGTVVVDVAPDGTVTVLGEVPPP